MGELKLRIWLHSLEMCDLLACTLLLSTNALFSHLSLFFRYYAIFAALFQLTLHSFLNACRHTNWVAATIIWWTGSCTFLRSVGPGRHLIVYWFYSVLQCAGCLFSLSKGLFVVATSLVLRKQISQWLHILHTQPSSRTFWLMAYSVNSVRCCDSVSPWHVVLYARAWHQPHHVVWRILGGVAGVCWLPTGRGCTVYDHFAPVYTVDCCSFLCSTPTELHLRSKHN